MTAVRLTHIGGPTTLIELAGWRLLTDPTFEAPGRRYAFGWGTHGTKVAGPSLGLAELGSFLLDVPPPLCLGTVELADGSHHHGFLCEPWALDGAPDITRFGGWRAYLQDLAAR